MITMNEESRSSGKRLVIARQRLEAGVELPCSIAMFDYVFLGGYMYEVSRI